MPRPVPFAGLRKPRPPVFAPPPRTHAHTRPLRPVYAPRSAPPARPSPLRACRGRRRMWGMRARGRVARKGRGHTERGMVQPAPSPWCPRVRAKGMRARRGATQAGEPRMNGRVRKGGRTKAGVRKGAGDGRQCAPARMQRGRVCERGGTRMEGGAHSFRTPAPSRST